MIHVERGDPSDFFRYAIWKYNMFKFKHVVSVFFIIVFILFIIFGEFHNTFAQQRRMPILVQGKTFLPLRVLARPFSNIYKQPDERSNILQENVPVFHSYFVYTRPNVTVTGTIAEGWYEVGPNDLKIHDMLGNVSEMTNTFYQIFDMGRIGGFVSRGGNCFIRRHKLRSSLRNEQPFYRVVKDRISPTKSPTLGFRAVISSQIFASRQTFRRLAAAWGVSG